eukprot:Sdes_comp18682_c0_seq1m8944
MIFPFSRNSFFNIRPTSNKGGFFQPYLFGFENPSTKQRIHSLLSVSGILETCHMLKAKEATREQLLYVHTAEYVDSVKQKSDSEGGDAGDVAYVGRGSYEIALLSAGSAIVVVEAVLNSKIENAYALIRPPGHHAEKDMGMGYCLFNNIAIAAHHALRSKKVAKIAIVDFDVHHGNGTQQAFYDNKNVFFISVHQDQLYPHHTGSTQEMGVGQGKGYNLNIPLPPGCGQGAYFYAFESLIIPSLKKFKPDLILASCGFDAASTDPIAH